MVKALPVHPWSLKGDYMSWRVSVLFYLSAVEMGVHAGCIACAKLTSATAWLRNGPVWLQGWRAACPT